MFNKAGIRVAESFSDIVRIAREYSRTGLIKPLPPLPIV
jgi:hypothetical protein